MELIRINDKKLKIMLTSSDMKNYDLDAQKLNCATEETRRAFRNILHDAGVRGGFDASADKIYVQFYPSREGGCEMFVTRLEICGLSATPSLPAATSVAQGSVSSSVSISTMLPPPSDKTNVCAYSFPSLKYLLRICADLSKGAYRGTSAAFYDDSGTFYLILNERTTSKRSQRSRAIAAHLGEFGTLCDIQNFRWYIEEHGTALCPRRAVETLGKL